MGYTTRHLYSDPVIDRIQREAEAEVARNRLKPENLARIGQIVGRVDPKRWHLARHLWRYRWSWEDR